MSTLTVTSKGQVTFKRDFLKHLGIQPGQKIEVEKTPHGGILIRSVQQQDDITDFIGCLAQPPTIALSLDEMNDITSSAWANTL